MGVDPSQTPEEGAGPLPSPSLRSSSKGISGETYTGEGAGPQAMRVGYRAIEEQEPRPGRSRGMAQGPFARIHSLLIPD